MLAPIVAPHQRSRDLRSPPSTSHAPAVRTFLALVLALALGGCGSGSVASGSTASTETSSSDVVGPTSREQLVAALPRWGDAIERAPVDEEASRALASVPAGAHVDVYLGTWCGDSRREVTRFLRALEHAPEPRPFTVALIGVDRAKQAPGLPADLDLRYVPTFVVRRGGAEVGRVVESAPRGIERELVDLLTGARAGVISGRTDL